MDVLKARNLWHLTRKVDLNFRWRALTGVYPLWALTPREAFGEATSKTRRMGSIDARDQLGPVTQSTAEGQRNVFKP